MAKRRGPVYHLDAPCRVETCDALGERFAVAFDAGQHEPRSEREELALELLCASGLGRRADAPGAAPGHEEV